MLKKKDKEKGGTKKAEAPKVTRKTHAERKDEITDAALRLIASRGLAALTVTSLSAEVGLTGGALYRHFPSTDAIIEAAAERAVVLLEASFPDPKLSPPEWLDSFVELRTRAVSGHRGVASLILSEQLAQALPETATKRLQGVVRNTFSQIRDTLRRGQAEGSIRKDFSADDLTILVMGVVQMTVLSQTGALFGKTVKTNRAYATLRSLLAA